MDNSFSELLKIHVELDELFLLHQHALLHFEFDKAADLLKKYRATLNEHMRFEEDVLLPIYTSRAVIERSGETKLFLDEHKKMRDWVQLFSETIAELAQDPAPENKLLKLLDRESFFLKLCSHHDNREARFLYPSLDAATTNEERAQLLTDV